MAPLVAEVIMEEHEDQISMNDCCRCVHYKRKELEEISQFIPISLLNVEGKISFSVMAARLTKYLINKFVDQPV